jgi:beta-glucosidase
MLRLVILAVAIASCSAAAAIETSQRVADLIANMSVEEKCGQMTQITFVVLQKYPFDINDPDDDQIDENKLREAIEKYQVGSILNTPLDTAQKASTWQSILTKIHDFNK